MPDSRTRFVTGTLAFLCASVLWGLNIPMTITLLKSFDPFWVSPNRYVVAALVLGMLVVATHGVRQLLSPIPLARLGVMSLCVALFLVLYNLGLYTTEPITAAAITAGAPIYVAVVSRMMTGAKLESGFWGATVLTLIGAGIAIYGRMQSSGQGLNLRGGEILLVFALASWAAYSILAQRWFSPDTSALRRTYLSSLGAIPWLLLFWFAARVAGLVGAPNLNPTPAAWAQLLVTAVLCTAIATVAWNMGVARLGVANGAMWQNMVPVFAVLISLLFFGVRPMASQLLGGAVVMAGVMYMQWRKAVATRG